jgi:TamB, inner membrane protein subunit of TAM complex
VFPWSSCLIFSIFAWDARKNPIAARPPIRDAEGEIAMKWLRRLALFGLLLVVGAAVAWRLFSARADDWLRSVLEEQLASALDTRAEVGAVSVALAPPQVGVRAISLGPDGEWMRAAELTIRLLPYTSVKQLRPVVEVEAGDVWVDVTRLPSGEASAGETQSEVVPPPFRVRRLRVKNAKVRIPLGQHPLDVALERLDGHVEASREGRITLGLDAEKLRLARRDARVGIDRIALQGGQTERGLVVRKLNVRGEEIEIDAALEEMNPLRHRVRADVRLAPFADADEAMRGVAGRLRLAGTLTGTLSDPGVEASLSTEHLRVREADVGDVHARLVRTGDRLEIDHASLVGFGGEMSATGSLTISGAQPFAVQARWGDLDAARIAAVAGAGDLQHLRIGGEADLSGKLIPFSLAGSAKGRVRSEAEAPPLEWELGAQVASGVNRIQLAVTQGSGNRVQANVALGPGEALAGTVEARIDDTLAVQSFAGVKDLPRATGTFSLSSRLSGTTEDPRLEGSIGGRQVKVPGGGLEGIEGRFAADAKSVRTDGIRLALGKGTIDVTGTFGIDPGVENAWQVRMADVDAGLLAAIAGTVSGTPVPVSDGTLSASLSGRGAWKTAALDGTVAVRRFTLAGEPVEALDVTLAARLPSWTVDARLAHREGEALSARAQGVGGEKITARLSSTPWSLAKLAAAARTGLSGTVQVDGSVSGPVAALDGHIDVDAEALAVHDRILGDADVAVRVVNGAWNARARLLDGALQVSANVLGKDRFSLDAEWKEAHFGPLLSADETLRIDSSGTLHVSGRTAAPQRLDGELLVPALTLGSGSLAVDAAEPIRVRGTDGSFSIDSLRLAGSGTTLEMSGTVTTAGKVDVGVKGAGSLQLLETAGDPIESARGTFEVQMRVERPPAGEPRLGGRLSLAKAALDVGLPFGLTQTDGEILFDGSRVEIEKLAGDIGGGKFSVAGRVDLSEGPDLTWQVDEMSTGMLPSVEHELSGKGSVRGSWNELTVGGDVEILRALYDKRIELTSFLPSFKRELPKPPEPESGGPRRIVHLKLHVFAPDELFIDNNFARIEAQADLHVEGDAAAPRLGGQIQVLSGQVFFRDRTFDVTTAVIDFRPELGFVAFLNIIAETEIPTSDGTYTVRLQVTGTTDDPRVTMTSDDPSLTPNDVASLIAFGKTVAQLQQEGGGVSVSDVLLLAPGGYPEKAQKGAASLLRLDRVDVEPTFSRTTGEFEPQLILAKNFTEDIAATLTSTFGATASQILRLTYQVTSRISLLANWETESQNRDQAIGGGVRYRREFRDTPGFSLLELGNGSGEEGR